VAAVGQDEGAAIDPKVKSDLLAAERLLGVSGLEDMLLEKVCHIGLTPDSNANSTAYSLPWQIKGKPRSTFQTSWQRRNSWAFPGWRTCCWRRYVTHYVLNAYSRLSVAQQHKYE